MKRFFSRRKRQSGNPEQAPDYFGMRLKDLNEKTWRDIGTIYLRAAFHEDLSEESIERRLGGVSLRSAMNQLERGSAEFRIGSRLTMHSKLQVMHASRDVIRFDFYGNTYPDSEFNPSLIQQQEEIAADFKTRTEQYLTEQRLAVPIYRNF